MKYSSSQPPPPPQPTTCHRLRLLSPQRLPDLNANLTKSYLYLEPVTDIKDVTY